MEFLRKYIRAMAKRIIKQKKEMGHELEDDEKEAVARNFTYHRPNKKNFQEDPRGKYYRKTKSH